jgi:excisionase family DNA binding protein
MSDTPEWYLRYARSKDEAVFDKLTSRQRQSAKKREHRTTLVAPKKASDLVDNLTAQEVATYLRCDLSYVYEQIRMGNLRCQPYGKRRVVPVTALHEFLEAEKEKYYAGIRTS